MAQFSNYTAIDAPADADIFLVYDDSAGATRKVTLQQLGDYIDTDQGFVTGPGSSTDNAVARFDSTTGKIVQNSGVIIDDSDNVTGVNTLAVVDAATTRSNLGLAIGTNVQAYSANLDALAADPLTATTASSTYLTIASAASTYQPLDADLTAIAALSSADGNFIVGSATGWVAESGATARTSLGLGTGDSPTLAGLTTTGSVSVGTSLILGTASAPAAGHIYKGPTTGTVIYAAAGSTYDFILANSAGSNVITVATGTTNTVFAGTLASGTITVSSDLTLASGSITSASGAISFGNENLSTTQGITAQTFTATSATGTGRFTATDTGTGRSSYLGQIAAGGVVSLVSAAGAETVIIRSYGDIVLGAVTLTQSGSITTTGTLASGNATVTGNFDVTGSTPNVYVNSTTLGKAFYGLKSNGNSKGFFAMSGAWLGNNSENIAIAGQSGVGVDIYTNGSTTATASFTSSGATVTGTLGVTGAFTNTSTGTSYFSQPTAFVLGTTATSSNAQFYATKTYSAASGDNIAGWFNHTQSVATTGAHVSLRSDANITHTTGTVANAYATQAYMNAAGNGGTTTGATASWARVVVGAGHIVTNAYSLKIEDKSRAGTITNDWAIHSEDTAASFLQGSLRIGTTSATSHGLEVLRLNGAANILQNVHRADSGASYIQFTNTTTGTAGGDGLVVGVDANEAAVVFNQEATPIQFYTNATERFRVASNAYALGIGTTDVEAWSSNYAAIEFHSSAIMGRANSNTGELYLISNMYFDGAEKYKYTGQSAQMAIKLGLFEWQTATSGTADTALTWSTKMTLTNGGMLLVGDTANANMTVGLTINQGANDDEILAFKSSDVAHGYTSGAETDTFGRIRKVSGTLGGLQISSYAEDGATSVAMFFDSYGGTADTTKSTAGRSLVEFDIYEHDGANSLANITADGNIFGIRARVGAADVTRWILDEDGDTWQTGSLTTGAPSGGTAAPWKLGTVSATAPTSPDRTIEVDINGTTYYIHAKTTND